MNFNYVDVEESVREKAKICAEKAGYEFLYIVKQSNHPNDCNTYICATELLLQTLKNL